jgi:PhnB protein
MQLEPYLFFTGNCEEALNYYKDVFGGEIVELSRHKDAPAEAQTPPESANLVMHATFKGPGFSFMAGDARPGTTYGEGPMSLSLSLTDQNEGQRIFDALAKGGKVDMPMQDMFWGAKFGMLTDRFGIDWMFNCVTEAQTVSRN